ncbi:MAG: hypothetical protein WBM15_13875, partial [Chromatiaceae bacterium]
SVAPWRPCARRSAMPCGCSGRPRTTPPHAIAVSPRVLAAVAKAVLTALMALETEAPELLRGAALGPLARAEESYWD